MIDRDNMRRLLNVAVAALKEAGEAVMEIYNRPVAEAKISQQPIDEANFVAQNIIKESLGHTRIPILSEEGRDISFGERKSWELFWLVDPLDGRVEFVDRNNEFTINIALMWRGEAILGAIYLPYLGCIYYAERGRGAFRCCDLSSLESGERLPLSSEVRDVVRVAVTRSHQNQETQKHLAKLRETMGEIEVVEQGSSYKFCMLAEGGVDYYARLSATYEWDTAAGELILSEAGGATERLIGGRLLYNKESLENPHFRCWRRKAEKS